MLTKGRALRFSLSTLFSIGAVFSFSVLLLFTGCGVTTPGFGTASSAPTVGITASPTSITSGGSSTLTVTAANATQVTVTGTDGSSYTLQPSGGTQVVKPAATTTYTAVASGAGGKASATTVVTMGGASASPPPTVSLTANPTSITSGEASTLTMTAANATQVTVTGTDGSSYTLQPSGGTQSVSPMASTTYTAVATGAGGMVSAKATVAVGSVAAPPPTVAIMASPASINSGGSSTLTVTAANATQVTVTGTDGSSYTLQPNGGTQAVSPAVTTTYTAVATGAGGMVSAKATIAVGSAAAPLPTVGITASPASITSGGSSTLTVTAMNATQVTVTGTDGSRYNLQPNGGTQAVSPTVTTTYTAVATGVGGNASAATTITVGASPVPTVSITSSAGSISSGTSVTLTVIAANATQVTVTGSDGSRYNLPPSGGTQAVSPTAQTTYTALATSAGGGKASATTTIMVVAKATPTVQISANPASIAPGSSSTLTVTAANATQVTITGTDHSSYNLQPNGGSVAVSPAATTTYTAVATGAGTQVSAATTVTVTPAPTVTITANPTSITTGSSSTLAVTAANATQVTVTGTDNSTYDLQPNGGTQVVSPTATTTYTAEATGAGGKASATTVVTVVPLGTLQSINHVVFMLQENHTFDDYFGMLNPYRHKNNFYIGDDGKDYEVDGIDDKLGKISNQDDQGNTYKLFKFASTCIDDETSSWLESYGDVNRYDFLTTRTINMDGFVHNAAGYAKNCADTGTCSGNFTDMQGVRSMGYYDESFLNYYYYMASQFAVSDRWFSPVSSKSIDNRIATFTGGTTQGLVFDPGNDDHLPQLDIPTIFQELDDATPAVSWKIYYTVTDDLCPASDECSTAPGSKYPATDFASLAYSYRYMYIPLQGQSCTGTTQPSSVVGDSANSFCIDPNHIAPLDDPKYGYFQDVANGTLPSFAFIEAGYGNNDEHPGSGQSILNGQQQVATVVNAFMNSPSWKDSVFFLSYDEGGGPYDHVPPVPGHSNDNTDASLGTIPDISQIAVNPDEPGLFYPCVPPTVGTPTTHCDLNTNDPGANPGDAAAQYGFAAQLGFRLPNMIISPFTRKHYVSHTPMDHTAVIKFVENRFIGPNANLTARDKAQPDLLEFFDFTKTPWATPPTPPAPVSTTTLGYDPCTPTSMGNP